MPEIITPKILVIDDQFGSSLKDRRNLCALFGLNDITGDDDTPERIKKIVSDAMFCSGQVWSNGRIENSIKFAHDAIAKGWPAPAGWHWALILLDLRFKSGVLKNGEPAGQDGDDTFGLSILDDIRQFSPDIPVVILSGRDRSEVIETCRNKGACDFVQRVGYGTDEKPPREILHQKINEHGLIEDNRDLKSEKFRIVGRSLSIMKVLRDARRAATGAGNILLLGETGTGKELLARYIHDLSPRKSGPYNLFEASRTAETLQEDELFGHEKGAFTGAISSKHGVFEASNGGTLFIDELGDITEPVQNKLLRPIESRQIRRQGGVREIPLDIQIVLATNKDLDEYARTGKFKIDLLNRVKAYTITLPPLKERKEDIPPIANHLLEYLCIENNARWPRKILPETIELLIDHDWPDNVRGLRNILERAVKNNKDSELLVQSDISFESHPKHITVTEQKFTLKRDAYDGISLDNLIKVIIEFQFPNDYSTLQGKLPAFQQAIAKLFANYLASAIEVSKKRRPGATDGELNLTGAASCMAGKQLTTLKAADLVKKLLQQDDMVLRKSLEDNAVLKKAYEESVRLRPKKPKIK